MLDGDPGRRGAVVLRHPRLARLPAVFVHGVPETPEIWAAVIDAIGRDDTVTLRYPGFGCPLPDGFEPTMDAYAAWLSDELRRIDGPIDLVSHDWGAFLCDRILADRPPNVRSWVTDGNDMTDDFQWHDLARLWQTPGDGEEFMASLVGSSSEERAALLVGAGMPADAAPEVASHIDSTMADAILVLYRSAIRIGPEWGPGIDRIDVPTLVLEAEADPYRRPGLSADLADRVGAALETLPGRGHWWMLEDPVAPANAIRSFWQDLMRP